jgi:hypothetical protein
VIARLPFTVTTPVEETASSRFGVAAANLRYFSKHSGERVEPHAAGGVRA